MKIFVIGIIGMGICCTSWGQKTPVQLALNAACLKIYEESLLGKHAYKLALRDLQNSANRENYKIESNESKDLLRQLSILDSQKDTLPALIVNALRANLNGYDSFDAYIVAIAETDRQKKLEKQKTVKGEK